MAERCHKWHRDHGIAENWHYWQACHLMAGNWHYWQGGHRITENRHDQPEPGGEATMVATGERLIQLDKGKRRHTA